jgi:hypothetical protein
MPHFAGAVWSRAFRVCMYIVTKHNTFLKNSAILFLICVLYNDTFTSVEYNVALFGEVSVGPKSRNFRGYSPAAID